MIISISKESNEKKYLFTSDERLKLIKEIITHLDNVKVSVFNGLFINYVNQIQGNIIIRGLRAFSDFESEFQMSLMNRKLDDYVNTIFLMPHEKYTHISSSVVREVASLGGDVGEYVPNSVLLALNIKYG